MGIVIRPGVIANFDVTDDGNRLAALLSVEEPAMGRNRMVLMTGFFDELERRAPR